jgi:hypothetical protein
MTNLWRSHHWTIKSTASPAKVVLSLLPREIGKMELPLSPKEIGIGGGDAPIYSDGQVILGGLRQLHDLHKLPQQEQLQCHQIRTQKTP